jgi:hypothetical protein
MSTKQHSNNLVILAIFFVVSSLLVQCSRETNGIDNQFSEKLDTQRTERQSLGLGVGAKMAMEDSFEGTGLMSSNWSGATGTGSAKLVKTSPLSGNQSLQLAGNVLLNSKEAAPGMKDYLVATEFMIQPGSAASEGESFVFRVSDGVPGFRTANDNTIVFRMGRKGTKIWLSGPQASALIAYQPLSSEAFKLTFLFMPGNNQFKVFVNERIYGTFYYGTGSNPAFRHPFKELFDIALESRNSANIVIDNFKIYSLSDNPTNNSWWKRDISFNIESAISKGPLTNFYRGTQIQAQGMQNGVQGLRKVPSAWRDEARSFKYQKRHNDNNQPYDKEVFFADKLSFVRFSGGWSTQIKWGENTGVEGVGDLVRRDENGRIKYEFDKIKGRIDPFVGAGYTDLTFSIDNVPYALAIKDSNGKPILNKGPYGQIAGPVSSEDWTNYVTALSQKMLNDYPNDAKNWRFRVGTEPNCASRDDEREHTFWGTHSEFVSWYESTFKGLSSTFNNSMRLGPGEFSGSIPGAGNCTPSGDQGPVDYLDLVRKSNTNNWTMSFIGNSSHSIPRLDAKNNTIGADPVQRAIDTEASFKKLFEANQALQNTEKFIFQYGILQSELTHNNKPIVSSEAGGRGAAWTFISLFELWERVGFSGIWHWDVADDLGADMHLLRGQGWLYTILDNLRGGKLYSLPSSTDSQGTKYKTLFVTKGTDSYVLMAAFNSERSFDAPSNAIVKVPINMLPQGNLHTAASWVFLDEKNNIHQYIKSQLGIKGYLAPEFDGKINAAYARLIGSLTEMANPADRVSAINWARQNYVGLAAREGELLTLKDFATAENTFRVEGSDIHLSFNIKPDSVVVIKIP